MINRNSKNNRKDAQVRQALLKQTPYLNAYGQTPAEMRKSLVLPRTQAEKRLVSRQPMQARSRPLKVVKPPTPAPSPIVLLESPGGDCLRASAEYPTPIWFRSTEVFETSVIVPVYKSQDVLKDLIGGWPLEDTNVEVIFVDDCCPNNSKEVILRCWQDRISDLGNRKIGKIIYNAENRGYGAACNIGASCASGKNLVFLNADTRLTPGWLRPMVELLNRSDVGIVGNLHIKEGGDWGGTIDSAGSEWLWDDNCFVHLGRHTYERRKLSSPWSTERAPRELLLVGEREMVTGCCFAIKKDLFEYVGGFNANYRIGYWEDAELCLTVRELGRKVMFQPNSVIYHKLSHTNSGGHEYQEYNRNFFINKWVNSGRIDDLVTDSRQRPEINTILLQRRGANGDVLVASAVAQALKRKHPGCKVHFSTNCPSVIYNNPNIDKVTDDSAVSERQVQVYYNLDMIYEFRPKVNILTAYAEAVGVKREDCKIYMYTEAIQGLPEEYIVVHAGQTAWVGRNWNGFTKISEKLLEKGHKIICIGSVYDSVVPCTFDLRGKTTVSQLAYVIGKAKRFVGIDSFPMHVAQAFDVGGACFFGSVDPTTRLYSANMKAVTANDLSCLGCHNRKVVPCTVTNICERGKQECVDLVTIDDFMEKL